ncbi:MAG TPA: hypothetical protein VLM85_05105 [Polyangiaceae bacterium]|nr:hypothetical protein [Polyangiaceae bacterium]
MLRPCALFPALLLLASSSCAHEPQASVVELPPAAGSAPPASTSAPPPPEPAAPPPSAVSAPEPSPAPVDSSSPAILVDRDVWVAQFEVALPVALCKAGTYFRACFAVTPALCEQTAASATRVCLNKVKKQLPPKLRQPDEGREWGTKIGSCAGSAYEVALSTKKIQSQKCSDPSVWTQSP